MRSIEQTALVARDYAKSLRGETHLLEIDPAAVQLVPRMTGLSGAPGALATPGALMIRTMILWAGRFKTEYARLKIAAALDAMADLLEALDGEAIHARRYDLRDGR